jgi:hypothetical protein
MEQAKAMEGMNLGEPITARAAAMILMERTRQLIRKGHLPEHDDLLVEGQLALLAAYYAMTSRGKMSTSTVHLDLLLAELGFTFKPKDPIRDLVRAGALIMAELERRLRAEEGKS